MNKKAIAVLCSLIAVSAFIVLLFSPVPGRQPILWEDDFENGLFRFNSTKHTVHGRGGPDSRWIVPGVSDQFTTFEEYYAVIRYPAQVIVVGEVVGPSMNRITHPRIDMADLSIPVTFNHVITPVLVHHIIYIGDDIVNDIRVGEVIDVRENHYFVTPKTQAYVRGIPVGEVMTQFGMRPMESGHRYLMFIHNGGNISESLYNYNGEIILGTMDVRDIYRLTPIVPHCSDPYSWTNWHRDAMARFGHLYHELPATPPAPIIEPRTEHELNIIIQGAPIATAIYDGYGNRLIQDGLNLYRQGTDNSDSLERVGQRISLSHALRRYQYILELGEWIFKYLDFSATALPSSFQVIAFENYEKVGLTYYADSPSSSHMKLRILPNGQTVLMDMITGEVIEPTDRYTR